MGEVGAIHCHQARFPDTTMKKQLSINELIEIKYSQFAKKDAFIMFIQDECEVRGINAEETLEYVQYAKRRFEHQEKWEALIKQVDSSDELNANATFEEFLGNISRVEVQFKDDSGVRYTRTFLNDGINILNTEEGRAMFEGAWIKAITNYDFLIYIPAKIVPTEFILKYVDSHKKGY